MKEQVLGVIPARLNSSRLPQKPLLTLAGKPLVEWVWANASEMRIFDKLVIATDSVEIGRVCEKFGAPVEVTSTSHLCGTERVAEVANMDRYREYGMVINVQGDLPLLEETCLKEILVKMESNTWDVGTCGAPFQNEKEWRDLSKVKLLLNPDNTVRRFFRDPSLQEEARELKWNQANNFRHIGVYVCKRQVLFEWASATPGITERAEKLEQLRAVDLGLSFGAITTEGDAGSVDTLEDVQLVERTLTERRVSS